MNLNYFVERYANSFDFKKIDFQTNQTGHKETYVKNTKMGFVVIENLLESKYVNFYLNDETKIFKKGDLLLCAMDNIPAAWEVER